MTALFPWVELVASTFAIIGGLVAAWRLLATHIEACDARCVARHRALLEDMGKLEASLVSRELFEERTNNQDKALDRIQQRLDSSSWHAPARAE